MTQNTKLQNFLSASRLGRLLDLSGPTVATAIRSGRLKADGKTGTSLLFLEERLPEIKAALRINHPEVVC